VTTRATRVCGVSGLALSKGPETAFRIARESYGPFHPPVREPSSDPQGWSRYDTPGRTTYASEDKLTAYMEMLAPYRTEIEQHRRALQPVADSMGMKLDDYWKQVLDDWGRSGHMHAEWLPEVFREGRAVYELTFPSGWWIDITSTDTISALHNLFGGTWPTAHGTVNEPLTLSHLTSDDRILTTAIATALRERITLDDGTLPLGIQFISKHGVPTGGSGLCWAYWMRDVDNGLDETAAAISTVAIEADDADFKLAQQHCKIKSR